ncbi:MAG: TfoX/Sxy family protein [Lawsonibacter sp.]|nr:TfoX/Sxy family protein [Lawsonibacter sp.]
MAELSSMRNIGREMTRKLASVGIGSPEKLRELGAKQAYFRLKEVYPQVCLVHLYVLEGAVCDLPYNGLPEDKKRELKAFSDFLSGRAPAGQP